MTPGKVFTCWAVHGSGGMLGDVEVEDPAPMVGQDDQDEEHTQLSGGHGEEVEGDEVLRYPGIIVLRVRR